MEYEHESMYKRLESQYIFEQLAKENDNLKRLLLINHEFTENIEERIKEIEKVEQERLAEKQREEQEDQSHMARQETCLDMADPYEDEDEDLRDGLTMPEDVKNLVQERIEETQANYEEQYFDQSDMYLEEFKQNMKSNANIRQGDGLNDIPDHNSNADSEGSLQDELGSLQSELGSFNSFMGHHQHAQGEDEEVKNDDETDQTAAMVEVLKNCSKIKDIDEIEEREGADDLDSDSEEDDQFDAMKLQRTEDENEIRITETTFKMEMAIN